MDSAATNEPLYQDAPSYKAHNYQYLYDDMIYDFVIRDYPGAYEAGTILLSEGNLPPLHAAVCHITVSVAMFEMGRSQADIMGHAEEAYELCRRSKNADTPFPAAFVCQVQTILAHVDWRCGVMRTSHTELGSAEAMWRVAQDLRGEIKHPTRAALPDLELLEEAPTEKKEEVRSGRDTPMSHMREHAAAEEHAVQDSETAPEIGTFTAELPFRTKHIIVSSHDYEGDDVHSPSAEAPRESGFRDQRTDGIGISQFHEFGRKQHPRKHTKTESEDEPNKLPRRACEEP